MPEAIAIIGMAGRFPGAANIDTFWQNLVDGVESISHFTRDDLEVGGPEIDQPNYVKARGVLADVDMFDAAFFGYTPRDAQFTDPQLRIFQECAWEALEDAGYDPERYGGSIGVYAGCSMNTYLLHNLCTSREFTEQLLAGHQMSAHAALLGNDKDFLVTRVSYKLNLRGPSMVIQSACSTSLVAAAQACHSLLGYQCDIALAGGVSISFPQKRGYPFLEGAMVSEDGHCRPFDASAGGTVFGGGVGIVVLRRLSEALEAGDNIVAVIKGAAINNDGSGKVSYMAPSVDGQAEVIATAQALAGISPNTISFVETHGTGTPLGDPIEIAALTKAFRLGTDARGSCAIGAVKGNVGHLESAAGVTGLIKTALMLKHRTIPPTIHFQNPNPKCDFENSPFHVVSEVTDWKAGSTPRRAGVSAFGIGGTNAHLVLEEAPPVEPALTVRPLHLLVISTKTATALDRATENLRLHLAAHPELNLADVAFTLQAGRKQFNHRRALVCRDAPGAIHMLEAIDPKTVYSQCHERGDAPVAFLFPGQGAQYANMGRQLYETERVFREAVDCCCAILEPQLELDLRPILYPPAAGEDEAQRRLTETWLTQPALFVIEYALARLVMHWGIQPSAMLGHSVGEYVAACLSEVFSLEDALGLLATRARLMQTLPPGSMLAVRAARSHVEPLLDANLSIAAVNSPQICVVSGPTPDVQRFASCLEERGIGNRILATSHAFHSAMMDPIEDAFTAAVERTERKPPRIPYLSNVTAGWITESETSDPSYWFRHLRGTVQFADAVAELAKNPGCVLVEVGPGQTLSKLARMHPARKPDQVVLATMPTDRDGCEISTLLDMTARLWVTGANIDWAGFNEGSRLHRVPLPTYPFERKSHWIAPARPVTASRASTGVSLDALNPPTDGKATPSGGQNISPETVQSPVPASQGNPSATVVEQIIAEQLRVMNLQLEALQEDR